MTDLPKLFDIGFQETRPIYPEFKQLAEREHERINELFTQLMEQYVKVHNAGNPFYSLDHFINNPNFIATPAFAASEESWNAYFKKLGSSDKAWKIFDYKLEEILAGAKHFQTRFTGGGSF